MSPTGVLVTIDDQSIRCPGVVIRLVELGNGRSKLVLDDVFTDSPDCPKTWSFDCFYTAKELDTKLIDEMALPSSDYQTLGELLVARLLALK